MVLYFLRDWIKDICYDYIVDDNVPAKERLVVLQKQVENFVFFAIKKPYGGNWKVYSEPDKLLQEALSSHASDSDSDSDDSNETGAGEESHSFHNYKWKTCLCKSRQKHSKDCKRWT